MENNEVHRYIYITDKDIDDFVVWEMNLEICKTLILIDDKPSRNALSAQFEILEFFENLNANKKVLNAY